MAERSDCYVHIEGDPENILFQLPSMSRSLREGDTLNVTLQGKAEVVYKVESVRYVLTETASGNVHNPHNFWKPPAIYYGVSILES